MCSRSLINSAFVVVFCFSFTARAAEPLKVCAEPDNLPMSQQSSDSGFEIEVAKLLANDLGRPLEIKWVPQRDQSYFRSTIGKGTCDAIMGIPVGFDRVLATKPWYRSGFAFVTRIESGSTLTSFADSRLKKFKIGAPVTGEGDIPPVIALTRRSLAKNLYPYSFFEPKKMVEAVANKQLDVAILWGPFASWYAKSHDSALQVNLTPEKDGVTPMNFDVAIGVKKGNRELKEQLDQSIARQQIAINAVLEKWHVPVRKP
jgi:mxaJ protein